MLVFDKAYNYYRQFNEWKALPSSSEITAQIAAGIQPIMVN
jgi:hypothetical protein